MSDNPWLVDNIKEFSFLNCPECTFKVKEEILFQYHALKNHPKSTALFGNDSMIEFVEEVTIEDQSEEQKCDFCDFVSTARSSLVQHIKDEHLVKDERFNPEPKDPLRRESPKKTKTLEEILYEDSFFADTESLDLEVEFEEKSMKLEQSSSSKRKIQGEDKSSPDAKKSKTEEQCKLVCDMCGFSTTKRRDLVIHFQMKHLYASKKMAIESDLNYKCDLCGYETTSFQSISGKVSLDGVRSYCDHDCETEKKTREIDMIKSLEPIRDMYGNLRKEEFACPYCEIVFDSKKEFTEHVVLHVEGYTCHYCDRTFSGDHYLNLHCQSHHKDSDGMYPCKHCSRYFIETKFSTIHELQEHSLKCDKNIKGKNVTVQFTGNEENVKNTKVQFKPPEIKTEFCPICDLPFDNKVLLRNHMKKVHRQKINDPRLIDDSEASDILIDRRGKEVEIPKVVSATKIMSYYTKRVIQEGYMPTYTTRNEYSCNKCKEVFDSLAKVNTHYETKCKKGVKTVAITMQESGYGKKINPDSIMWAYQTPKGPEPQIKQTTTKPETRKSPRKLSEKQKSDDKVNSEISSSEGKAIEYQCNYCDKYFPSKSKLWTHLNEQHNIDKSLQEVSTSDEDVDVTVDNFPSEKLLFQEKPAVIKFANRSKLQSSPSKKTSSIFKCQVPPAKNSPKKPKPSTSSTVNCQLSTPEPKQFRVQFKCTKCEFSTYEVDKLTEHTKNVHVKVIEKMQIKINAQERYRQLNFQKKTNASVQNLDDKSNDDKVDENDVESNENIENYIKNNEHIEIIDDIEDIEMDEEDEDGIVHVKFS